MNNIENEIVKKEVLNAVNYSTEGNYINLNKLEYYRKNLAEDSRYTFKIILFDMEKTGLAIIKYMNIIHRLTFDREENTFKYLN